MRPFTSTIPIAEALTILREAGASLPSRELRVPLREAAGRVAAANVRAGTDVPPFDRAAMDGYAVIAADLAGASPDRPVRLRRIGVTFTGEAPGQIARGTCVEVATGAPLPVGADAVVMVERTRHEGNEVVVLESVTAGRHVGRRGHDLKAGEVVVRRGDWLSPARVGALAAVGITDVPVLARPVVAIGSTGNEIVEPGRPLGPGQIHDVNRFTLAPVIRLHGGEVIELPTVEDRVEAVTEAFESVPQADLIVLSGGSSVGERDLLVDAAAARGEVLFHGLAIKPGKPTLCARLRRRSSPVPQLFIGLAGYPTSCLTNAYLLVVPLVRAMARLPDWRPERRELPLAAEIVATGDRLHFFSVSVEGDRVVPAFKGSGDITSLSRADGYIEIPPGTGRLAPGTLVTVTLFH